MDIVRPPSEKGIPVTSIDDQLDSQVIKTSHTRRGWGRDDIQTCLSKHEMFSDIIKMLEAMSSSKKERIDAYNNTIMTTYTVPIVGYNKLPSHVHHVSQRSHTQSVTDQPRVRYVEIDGHTYSNDRTYRYSHGVYIPIDKYINHDNMNRADLADGEQVFCYTKNISKHNIRMTFTNPQTVTALDIHPEKSQFKSVHSDVIRCRDGCIKKKHCITVMSDPEPGFLTKFELQYRSPTTDGKWIKHGIYTGNTNMFDSTKINFDEITMTELRIIPISFDRSFQKINVFVIGPKIMDSRPDEALFVDYVVHTPRDGHYQRDHDYVSESFSVKHQKCDCHNCTGVKGRIKRRNNLMRAAME